MLLTRGQQFLARRHSSFRSPDSVRNWNRGTHNYYIHEKWANRSLQVPFGGTAKIFQHTVVSFIFLYMYSLWFVMPLISSCSLSENLFIFFRIFFSSAECGSVTWTEGERYLFDRRDNCGNSLSVLRRSCEFRMCTRQTGDHSCEFLCGK